MKCLLFFFDQIQTVQEWRIVFMISSVIYLLGCLIYWCWASGEVQAWSKKFDPPADSTSPNQTKPNLVDRVSYVGYTNEAAEMDE